MLYFVCYKPGVAGAAHEHPLEGVMEDLPLTKQVPVWNVWIPSLSVEDDVWGKAAIRGKPAPLSPISLVSRLSSLV